MPYSTKNDVNFYGHFTSGTFGSYGYDEEATYQKAINDADSNVDDYCNVPEGFFAAGGIEIQNEILNGTDVALVSGYSKYYSWLRGGDNHLKFKHKPVLSITKFEEETSVGAWTTRTEGTDYTVVDDGARFIQNTPDWKYANVRVTYKAGYVATPWQVQQVSARLAAAILQNIQQASNPRPAVTLGQSLGAPPTPTLTEPIFSDALKRLLQNYTQTVCGFG